MTAEFVFLLIALGLVEIASGLFNAALIIRNAPGEGGKPAGQGLRVQRLLLVVVAPPIGFWFLWLAASHLAVVP